MITVNLGEDDQCRAVVEAVLPGASGDDEPVSVVSVHSPICKMARKLIYDHGVSPMEILDIRRGGRPVFKLTPVMVFAKLVVDEGHQGTIFKKFREFGS